MLVHARGNGAHSIMFIWIVQPAPQEEPKGGSESHCSIISAVLALGHTRFCQHGKCVLRNCYIRLCFSALPMGFGNIRCINLHKKEERVLNPDLHTGVYDPHSIHVYWEIYRSFSTSIGHALWRFIVAS